MPALEQDPAGAEGIVGVAQHVDDPAKRPTPPSELRHLGGLRRALPLHLTHLSFQRNADRPSPAPIWPDRIEPTPARTAGPIQARPHPVKDERSQAFGRNDASQVGQDRVPAERDGATSTRPIGGVEHQRASDLNDMPALSLMQMTCPASRTNLK